MTAYPFDWLRANVHGFDALSREEWDAILHFSLLWSLFEARVLSSRGSANAIVKATKDWKAQGKLDDQFFADDLAYFRHRYLANGTFTDHFEHLLFRKNDCSELVRAVLKNESTEMAEIVAALLIIIYRFRNNLFHGRKWEYGIQEQRDIFFRANAVLMKVLEIDGE